MPENTIVAHGRIEVKVSVVRVFGTIGGVN